MATRLGGSRKEWSIRGYDDAVDPPALPASPTTARRRILGPWSRSSLPVIFVIAPHPYRQAHTVGKREANGRGVTGVVD